MTPTTSRKAGHWHWKALFAILAAGVAMSGAQALDPPSASALIAEEGAGEEECAEWLEILELCGAEEEQDTGGDGSSGETSDDDDYYDGLDDCEYGGACWDEEGVPGGDDDTSDGYHTGDPCVDYGHCWPDTGDEEGGRPPRGTDGAGESSGDSPAGEPAGDSPEEEDPWKAADELAEAEAQAEEELRGLQLQEALAEADAAAAAALKKMNQPYISIQRLKYCREIRRDMNSIRLDADDDNGRLAKLRREWLGTERERLAELRGNWRSECARYGLAPPRAH